MERFALEQPSALLVLPVGECTGAIRSDTAL